MSTSTITIKLPLIACEEGWTTSYIKDRLKDRVELYRQVGLNDIEGEMFYTMSIRLDRQLANEIRECAVAEGMSILDFTASLLGVLEHE